MQEDNLLTKAREVAMAAKEKGGRALLVGGFVRDQLLGQMPKDADMEIYGIESAALRELLGKFGRVNCVGESFQVYKLTWRQQKIRHELDISIPRLDRKVSRGHRGFEVQGNPFSTIEEAARRRDFTVNAMMRDPLTDELLDPFGGQNDLRNGVLRMVDKNHFAEDSLRVLRAMQFAARFDLQIDPATAEVCRAVDLSDLPAERLWGEWEKLLMRAARPSRGLLIGQDLHVYKKLFPYLEIALERRGAELCKTLDGAADVKVLLAEYPRQITLMLSAIGAYLSRPERELLLKKLGVFSIDNYDVRRKVLILSGERKRAPDWFSHRETIEDKDFRFLAARLEPRLVYLLSKARGDEAAAEWFWENMQRLHIEDAAPKRILEGRHLLEMGMEPGPQIGKIINAVYLRQLETGFETLEEAKAEASGLIDQK
jgi:tRNA nucleotidyltransferase (CCA-adding enzyme)